MTYALDMSTDERLQPPTTPANQNIRVVSNLIDPVRAFPAIQRGQLIARRGGSGLGRSVISLVSRSRANWNSRLRCKIFAAQIAPYTHSVGHRSLV